MLIIYLYVIGDYMQQHFCVMCKNNGYIVGIDLVRSPCLCTQKGYVDEGVSNDDEPMQKVAELDALMSVPSLSERSKEVSLEEINAALDVKASVANDIKIGVDKSYGEDKSVAVFAKGNEVIGIVEIDADKNSSHTEEILREEFKRVEKIINEPVKKRGRPKKSI